VRTRKSFEAGRSVRPPQIKMLGRELVSDIVEEIFDYPAHVSELNALLCRVPVDLKAVAEIIRSQPQLSASITHLCRLTMPGFHDQPAGVEHGIVFLGIDQMRTLILACCMVSDLGAGYSTEQIRSFWRHSVLTASLAERIARYMDYPSPADAYRAGLFHDAGALALVRWAIRTRGPEAMDNTLGGELVEVERRRLRVDHCFAGKLIGQAWKLPAEIIDVLEFHHQPEASPGDRTLVGIVAAADRFCVERGIQFQLQPQPASSLPPGNLHQLLGQWVPGMGDESVRQLKDVLEITYLQKVTDFERGRSSLFCE